MGFHLKLVSSYIPNMHCLVFRASSNQLLPQTDVEASDLLPVELADQIVEVNVVFAFSLVVGADIKLSPD
jgi:hypothetical protein